MTSSPEIFIKKNINNFAFLNLNKRSLNLVLRARLVYEVRFRESGHAHFKPISYCTMSLPESVQNGDNVASTSIQACPVTRDF